MLKQTLFVLTLASFCLAQAKPTTFKHQKKNSIRVHPFNLYSFIGMDLTDEYADDYAFEIDYTRLLSSRFELVARYSIFRIDPSFIDFDATGDHKEWEVEIGMRYRNPILTRPNGQIVVYPQVALSGGDVDYYYYHYEKNELVDYSGKMARLYLIGGIEFDVKRFIFGLDLGLGIGLYVPNEYKRVTAEPNFTIGYAF